MKNRELIILVLFLVLAFSSFFHFILAKTENSLTASYGMMMLAIVSLIFVLFIVIFTGLSKKFLIHNFSLLISFSLALISLGFDTDTSSFKIILNLLLCSLCLPYVKAFLGRHR